MALRIQRSISVAASTTIENQLLGLLYSTLPYDALVTLALTQSATGLNVDFLIGTKTVLSSGQPNIRTTKPIYPDDVVIEQEPGPEGANLILKIVNTTVGALTLFYDITIEDAALMLGGGE